MDMVRWKYYLLMKQDQDTVEFSRGHDLQQWNWQTMNGRPAWGECKRCTARENWGMSDQDRDGGDDGAAVEMGDEEWAVVRVGLNFQMLPFSFYFPHLFKSIPHLLKSVEKNNRKSR